MKDELIQRLRVRQQPQAMEPSDEIDALTADPSLVLFYLRDMSNGQVRRQLVSVPPRLMRYSLAESNFDVPTGYRIAESPCAKIYTPIMLDFIDVPVGFKLIRYSWYNSVLGIVEKVDVTGER